MVFPLACLAAGAVFAFANYYYYYGSQNAPPRCNQEPQTPWNRVTTTEVSRKELECGSAPFQSGKQRTTTKTKTNSASTIPANTKKTRKRPPCDNSNTSLTPQKAPRKETTSSPFLSGNTSTEVTNKPASDDQTDSRISVPSPFDSATTDGNTHTATNSPASKLDKLTRQDKNILTSKDRWLNDSIIHTTLAVFKKRCTLPQKPHVTDPNGYNQFVVKKGYPNKEVNINAFLSDLVFWPCNINDEHWVLVVVDNKEKKILHVDSLWGSNFSEKCAKLIYTWNTNFRLKQSLPDGNDYKIKKHDIPFQTNSDDCGVAILWAAEEILKRKGALPHADPVTAHISLADEEQTPQEPSVSGRDDSENADLPDPSPYPAHRKTILNMLDDHHLFNSSPQNSK